MGFGLLFIGYLISHGFTSGANYIVSLVGIIGAVILFFACKKLAVYSKEFKYAVIVSVLFALSYLFNGTLQLVEAYAADVIIPPVLLNLSRGAIIAIVFGFNYFMYRGIADIARYAEVKGLAVSAVRNLVFMIIYYLDLIFAMILKPYFPKTSGVLGLTGAIIGVVWLVLSVWCVMSAYMKICLEGDEEMPDAHGRK